MKSIIILIVTGLFLALAAPLQLNAQEVQYDTLKAGDTVLNFKYKTTGVTSVTYGMQQLDTNATKPDSVKAFFKFNPMGITSPDIPAYFHETSDSVWLAQQFTYSTVGQFRSGWLYVPGIDNIKFVLANQQYLTNRKVVVWIKFNTK